MKMLFCGQTTGGMVEFLLRIKENFPVLFLARPCTAVCHSCISIPSSVSTALLVLGTATAWHSHGAGSDTAAGTLGWVPGEMAAQLPGQQDWCGEKGRNLQRESVG